MQGTSTRTMRVDKRTYERLLEISHASGYRLGDVVSQATEALERVRFAETVRAELDVLRSDRVAWAQYLTEFDL